MQNSLLYYFFKQNNTNTRNCIGIMCILCTVSYTQKTGFLHKLIPWKTITIYLTLILQ